MIEDFFWFPVHAGKFHQRVAGHSAEVVGCYILFCCYLVAHHHLPASLSQLRLVCHGAAKKSVTSALNLCDLVDGHYLILEIDEAKKKAAAISEKRKTAGEMGAKNRWKKS